MTQSDTKKKAMIAALHQSLGVVTSACKAVGISRETHYKWLREDVDYKYQVEDLSNIALDFAESQLHNQIKNGSTPATIFYLKTKGKKRGYIERQEIQHENLEPLTIEIIDSTSEDEQGIQTPSE
jgi:hypothetical protein|tara:strand:+ start:380 stop:754 length:375 start_codon:yes stop_codon:yes gene_type:complete